MISCVFIYGYVKFGFEETLQSTCNFFTENVRLDDEGVVEMFGGTGWKGVCSYSTSSKQNAKVICRQLNLSTYEICFLKRKKQCRLRYWCCIRCI